MTVMAESGAASSKGEARRLISGGGVYLNAQRVEDGAITLTDEHVLHGRFVVLRVGKKRYHLIEVVG